MWPWLKALALLWGPLVTLAVIATGNHYLFDAVTGLLVTGLAYSVSRLATELRFKNQRTHRPQRLVPQPAFRS